MKTEIINMRKSTDTDQQELYGLFRRFFANTDYTRFLADLSEKHWLIRMYEGENLVGFSTQQLLNLPWRHGTARFLYSGDTIVHPDYWNKSHLAGAFGHLFLRIAAAADSPLYWFLISKGFRTYRFLPVFFREFHPHFAGTGQAMKPLLDTVVTHKFGDEYNPETGVIDFDATKDYLIADLADIPACRCTDPHVLFFKRSNPSYTRGSELACIAPLSRSNLTPCGLRVIQSTEVAWNE